MSFQGVYNSTGGIQISFLGVYNSAGLRISLTGKNLFSRFHWSIQFTNYIPPLSMEKIINGYPMREKIKWIKD